MGTEGAMRMAKPIHVQSKVPLSGDAGEFLRGQIEPLRESRNEEIMIGADACELCGGLRLGPTVDLPGAEASILNLKGWFKCDKCALLGDAGRHVEDMMAWHVLRYHSGQRA